MGVKIARSAHNQGSIKTLSEYVNFVQNLGFDDDILFRGQSDSDWSLVPKIARIKLRDESDTPTVEQKMLKELKRQAHPHIPREPSTDWDWLALAQHHGMATRLLDWTTNALAGLWFCVKKSVRAKRPGVVWIFKPKDSDYVDIQQSISPYNILRTVVFRPNHITQRIVAQSGWFTAHYWLPKSKRFIPFEKNATYKKRLVKILIDSEAFADMRSHLDRLGVNHASMFPGIEGLCTHIDWLNTIESDEAN